MEFKAKIMDESQLYRSLARIAHEIIEKNNGADDIALIGIKRRGVPIAECLAKLIEQYEGKIVPVGAIDISLYRDDLTEIKEIPIAKDVDFPFDVKRTTIILVDDVLYTGRTARAAIDGIFRCGRPKSIQLAVLVDRGHRELPIRADFVGKNIPTSKQELIAVAIRGIDKTTGVDLYTL